MPGWCGGCSRGRINPLSHRCGLILRVNTRRTRAYGAAGPRTNSADSVSSVVNILRSLRRSPHAYKKARACYPSGAMTVLRLAATTVGVLTLSACSSRPPEPAPSDTQRIIAADTEPGSWLTHGRTYGEQRFSPLTKVSTDTVGRLGLGWTYEMKTNRSASATPLVVDGVMYVTSAWSLVYALDAATGQERWVYDPKVERAVGAKACCDVANRGVAVYEGKVFVGVIDGRLVALDAKTGAVMWETVTVDQSKPYTITGAPRAANGLVYIGNGGAEYGVRGYVSAYDVQDRQAGVALLHRPGRSLEGAGRGRLRSDHRHGRRDVERRVVEGGRRRDRLGRDRLRPRFQAADRRRRQRLAVEPADPLARRRRQFVPLVDRRARCDHWRVQVALPDDTRRHVGLHGHAAHHPRRAPHRRQAAKGRDAGAEERVLLRRRPGDWQADHARSHSCPCRRQRAHRQACPSVGRTPSIQRRVAR